MTQASTDSPVAEVNGDNAAQGANGHEVGSSDKPKKTFRRPKWNWGSRRRNEKKNKVAEADKAEEKAAEIQEPDANASVSAKEPVDTGDEQKDRIDLASVQVARAA